MRVLWLKMKINYNMSNKTKIIATIGPSSDHAHLINKLIKNGMNVARINMAHKSTNKVVGDLVETIRNESKKLNKHVSIMMDIAGPKIRVDLSNISNEEIEITKGYVYSLGFSKMNDIPINLDLSFKKIDELNAFVKIDDGKISFKILSVKNNILKVKAINDGLIKSNKGVNFPGVHLKVPSLTEDDKKNIKLGVKLGIDWFALSFVRASSDFNEFIDLFKDKKHTIPVIAKIEKPEAIENLDSIIDVFDGILIARGDLGVEMPLSKLPIIQKNIINKCRIQMKPVIIATQILESMIHESIPTRAEVNDVANAVYEQVDAVMLSGETAIGEYPIETVQMMYKIISNVESEYDDYHNLKNDNRIKNTRYAIGQAVKTITKQIEIDAIVVMTETGSTSKIVSYFRPEVDIFSLSPSMRVCNQMSLLWGVTSLKVENYLSTDEMLYNAKNILLKNKLMKTNQTFVMTAGVPVGIAGTTNMLKIEKI